MPVPPPVVEPDDGAELDLMLTGVTAGDVDGAQPGDAAGHHAGSLGVHGMLALFGVGPLVRPCQVRRIIATFLSWVRYEGGCHYGDAPLT
jgi:hypothetical protein